MIMGDGAEWKRGDGERGGVVGVEGSGVCMTNWVIANGGKPFVPIQR